VLFLKIAATKSKQVKRQISPAFYYFLYETCLWDAESPSFPASNFPYEYKNPRVFLESNLHTFYSFYSSLTSIFELKICLVQCHLKLVRISNAAEGW